MSSNVANLLSEYACVYIWLIFTTFVNIIAPVQASVVVNPVTAFFTDPQRAIGIGSFILFVTGLHRVFLFRRELLRDKHNIKIIKNMLPFSILGALIGGTVISYLNTRVLAVVIIAASLFFMYKTIQNLSAHKQEIKEIRGLNQAFVAVFSGFLQGSGMPGSDIRNNYLRSSISEVSVRAVSSAIGWVNFLIAGLIIFSHNILSLKDLIFVVSIVPILLLVQVYGKSFLDRMEDTNAKILAVGLSFVGVILLTFKYLF